MRRIKCKNTEKCKIWTKTVGPIYLSEIPIYNESVSFKKYYKEEKSYG